MEQDEVFQRQIDKAYRDGMQQYHSALAQYAASTGRDLSSLARVVKVVELGWKCGLPECKHQAVSADGYCAKHQANLESWTKRGMS